jgi:hypothetical protein
MIRLLRNISLFLLPLIAIIVLLPVNKRLKYQGLKDDCFNHGIWIYDRIFNNSRPIDVAFLGSSQTINGINDQLISEEAGNTQAVNLAYCRLGRNFTYVLLKELISVKNIKQVFIEVRENEDRYSHPIFPYIANTADVLLPNPFFNRDMLSDMWTHLAYKIEISQDMIYQHEVSVPLRTNDFGFTASHDTAATSRLADAKLKRSTPKKATNTIEENFHANYSRVYLRKIGHLCRENHIKLVFLYIPAYGVSLDKPKEYDTYIKYGKVLIPPKDIFEKQSNWYDENHLNQTGANEFSLWLAKQINME